MAFAVSCDLERSDRVLYGNGPGVSDLDATGPLEGTGCLGLDDVERGRSVNPAGRGL